MTKDELKQFGINKDMTTYEYVMWLDTDKGEKLIKSKADRLFDMGDFYTMHAKKSELISAYAKCGGK